MKVSDKVKVLVPPHPDTGEVYDNKYLADVLGSVDWTEDPGRGKSSLLPDGRELLNPVPFAPPVDYKPQDSIMDMIDRRLKERLAQLRGDEEVDTKEEAWDLDIPDDVDPLSVFEIAVMLDDFPGKDPNEEAKPPKILEKEEDIPKEEDNGPPPDDKANDKPS